MFLHIKQYFYDLMLVLVAGISISMIRDTVGLITAFVVLATAVYRFYREVKQKEVKPK